MEPITEPLFCQAERLAFRCGEHMVSAAGLIHWPILRLVLVLLGLAGLMPCQVGAQFTPAPMAIKLPDSLVFVGTPITNASLVWHPLRQRYYSARLGNSTLPLETWLLAGGASVAQTNAGIDTRGLWYAPGTGNIERNCAGGLGWANMNIDASSNAMNTFTQLFTGMNQPNNQSVGAYDWNTNTVLFYLSGSMYVYSRTTAVLLSTIPLTGTSLASVTAHTVMYTGQVGYEVCLYDYTNKRVLFFNRSSGAFSAMSQLPASATVSGTQFNVAYTNNRFWTFNSTTRKWNAYCVWQQLCSVVLPVELIRFEGACINGKPILQWATGSERNSSHFSVERSAEGATWITVGEVPAAGNSQQVVEYRFTDPQPSGEPVVYYRLRQTDLDGQEEVFDVVPLMNCGTTDITLLAFPNPVMDVLHVVAKVAGSAEENYTLELLDAMGRPVKQHTIGIAAGQGTADLDLAGLAAGSYTLALRDTMGSSVSRTQVVKH